MRRRQVLTTAIVCLLIHVVLIGPMFIEFLRETPQESMVEEIPVEIVQEPPSPPAPEPQKQADKKDEAQQPDRSDSSRLNEVARSAPRAAGKTDNKDARDKTTASPVQAPEDRQARKTEDPPAAAKDPPPPDRPDAEIAEVIPPKPPNAEPKPQPPAGPLSKQIGTMAIMPNFQFGAAAMSPSTTVGEADPTYTAKAFGLIFDKMPEDFHRLNQAAVARGASGSVEFIVDMRGNVSYRAIVHPSGDSRLDDMVYRAIGQAGPFPPPPIGGALPLVFTYGVTDRPT